MNVVSLDTLLGSAACVWVHDDVEVAAAAAAAAAVAVQDTAGAQAMVEGATAHVVDLQDVAVSLLVVAAIAGRPHSAPVTKCHMLMAMVVIVAEAGAEWCRAKKCGFVWIVSGLSVFSSLDLVQLCFSRASPSAPPLRFG